MEQSKKPKRVLLKLSGELLKGPHDHGIQPDACLKLSHSLKLFHDTGLQIGIVIGGGNIFRGIQSESLSIPRAPADYMGMLATMINGIALQQSLAAIGCPAHVMSGLECPKVVEPYNWYRANQYLDQHEIIIFVGGTGNPYFTTDTAASLRASEIQADLLLKATKVNGVYDSDPTQNPHAKRYDTLSYSEVLAQKLGVMDATSIALCRSEQIPILVFNMSLLIEDQITDIGALKEKGTWIQ